LPVKGLDRAGKLAGEPGDFRAQATQAFENVKAVLASVGLENIGSVAYLQGERMGNEA
jgi:enamine deaminase RidA (YjgF/YER057c/UK114 family)